jgi:nicotinic acid mononucleotide adenylyltransferase
MALRTNEALDLLKIKLPVVSPGTAPPHFIVLYAYGSFCPVHNGHIELVQLARDHYNNTNDDAHRSSHVLFSILAPSPSQKLEFKNGADAISDQHRWSMLRLALQAHQDIVLLFGETKEQLRTRLLTHLTAHYGQPIRLSMPSVCGPENLLAIKSKRIYAEGVVCVHSRAVPLNVRALLDKHPHKHCIQYVTTETGVAQPRSSTLIRNLLRTFYQGTILREELQTQLEVWMAPLVIEYLLTHRLWEN